MDEFKEMQLKKKFGSTPRELLNERLSDLDGVTEIVIIAVKDDEVVTDYICDDPTKLIGILETSKTTVISSWIEGE